MDDYLDIEKSASFSEDVSQSNSTYRRKSPWKIAYPAEYQLTEEDKEGLEGMIYAAMSLGERFLIGPIGRFQVFGMVHVAVDIEEEKVFWFEKSEEASAWVDKLVELKTGDISESELASAMEEIEGLVPSNEETGKLAKALSTEDEGEFARRREKLGRAKVRRKMEEG